MTSIDTETAESSNLAIHMVLSVISQCNQINFTELSYFKHINHACMNTTFQRAAGFARMKVPHSIIYVVMY